jgi:hypothetical protein
MEIKIELPDDIQSLWDDAGKLAKDNGILIEGDMSKGHFSIKGIKVNYSVSDRTLTANAKVPPIYSPLRPLVIKEIEKFIYRNKQGT